MNLRSQQFVACISVRLRDTQSVVSVEFLILNVNFAVSPLNYCLPSFSNQFCLLVLGGPYAAFGGKDASRGLATFNVTASELEYDDLSDLTPPEMDSVREWEMQFKGDFNE